MNETAGRMRGRPRTFDVDRALDRAIDVFWERGYCGAGVSELTAAMGLSPPSLYAAFGDKRGLFLAALDRYFATQGSAPAAALGATPGRAESLRRYLDAVVALVFVGERGRGCLAACVAGDAAGDDPAIRARLAALMRLAEDALAAAAGPGGPSGRVLLAAMQAVAVRARSGASRAECAALAAELAAMLARPA